MVLVDTSIWVSHFRKADVRLRELLYEGSVVCHPFVIGELACGSLGNRKEILSFLKDLPQASAASNAEVLHIIEHHGLMGKGTGFIDMHLLASALLTRADLWTSDKSLRQVSDDLGVLFVD